MGILNMLFGKSDPSPRDDAPFMEHPTGEFETALQAIRSAMQRLDQTDMGDRWIDFDAQGQGATPELTQIESVPFNGRTFDLSGQTVNFQPILDSTGLAHARVKVETSPDGKITLSDATPEQLARFLDALFQKHFGIKPFEDEGDYAVGAEW
jgi:hypothetical protein